MTVQREERGWAGHFICAYYCQFRRNTLLTCGDRRIVVSTVGSMYNPRGQREEIGYQRYYETMAFEAVLKNGYYEADVDREVQFGSPWSLNECDTQSDQKANAMHEAVVAELMSMLEGEEGATNEAHTAEA